MKKKTQREQVIELLKTGWYSGFAMNMAIKSTGGAPRITELKTTDPLEGWKIIERRNVTDNCQDYMLVPDNEPFVRAIDKQLSDNLTNELTGQTQLFKVESNHF